MLFRRLEKCTFNFRKIMTHFPMKKQTKNIMYGLILFSLMSAASCNQKKETTVVTPKIQYDVFVKSPDPSYDWWIQNIAGPQREQLVATILNGALSGKYPAYDYYYKPISPQQVSRILNDTLRKTVQEKKPPYELKDTLIVKKITVKDILKLRFMEQWEVNEQNLTFEKKVMGIAPVARITDPSGNTRWQPLFWLFPNKTFLKQLKQNQVDTSK